MTTRLLFAGGVLGALAVAAVLAATAGAQPATAQLVQTSEDALYVVQGGNAELLAPVQTDDSANAADQKDVASDAAARSSFRVLRSPHATFGYSLFITGTDVWNLFVDLIRGDLMATLTLGESMNGTVTISQPGPANIAYYDDGTPIGRLYLVQGGNSWLVVPEDIGDQQVSELGALDQKAIFTPMFRPSF